MSEDNDNLIDLASYREAAASKDKRVRDAQRLADRSAEAADLLRTLRKKARIPEDDRPIIARNLGRIIEQLNPASPLGLAKKVLDNAWEKRKCYVRRRHEDMSSPSRYAASGAEFARIIDRLKEEAERKGRTGTQALVETVLEALKGTSFRRTSRFRIVESLDDAPFLVSAMQEVCEALARAVDLEEYFRTVSKSSPWIRTRRTVLLCRREFFPRTLIIAGTHGELRTAKRYSGRRLQTLTGLRLRQCGKTRSPLFSCRIL